MSSLLPATAQVNEISGGKPSDSMRDDERFNRPRNRYRLVKDPKSGEIALVTQGNANDMIRHNGWRYATLREVPAAVAENMLRNPRMRSQLLTSKTLTPSELAQFFPKHDDVQEESAAAVSAAVVSDDYAEPTPQLDAARAAYEKETGKKPDMRWGISRLEAAIEVAKLTNARSQPTGEVEVDVDDVDEDDD